MCSFISFLIFQKKITILIRSFPWLKMSKSIPQNLVFTNRAQYKRITTEVRRLQCGVGRQSKIDPTLRNSVREWIQIGGFRWTRHLKHRIHQYHLRPSRDKRRYLEVTTPEKHILGNIQTGTQFINQTLENGEFKIVELGWNIDNELCKFGIVLLSPMYTNDRNLDWETLGDKNEFRRIMFLCIGLDRGLKTMYFTPGYKERSHGYSIQFKRTASRAS